MLKKVFDVLVANIIFIILSLIMNFTLPMLIPVEEYSVLKTFSFYIFYSGFAHLGYNDGMYLKYGGMDIKNISSAKFYSDYSTGLIFQVVIFSFFVLCSFFSGNTMILLVAFGILFTNNIFYFKNFFQATGEMKSYGIILNIEKILPFIFDVFLLFVLKTYSGYAFIIVQLLSLAIIWVFVLVVIMKKFEITLFRLFDARIWYDNIRNGIFLMLGNFSNNIFTGIDRWFVKLGMRSYDFAIYSFAVSLENMIGLLITPISLTLYNYFCRDIDKKNVLLVKKMATLWGLILIGTIFPIEFIINAYLADYSDSIPIIVFLFATQAFYSIIKSIYVNIYKATKRQRNYFLQTTCMIVVAIILDIVLLIAKRNMISLSIGTFITAMIWFIVCEMSEKEYKSFFKEYLVLAFMITIFIIVGLSNKPFIGGIVYFSLLGIVVLAVYRNEIKEVVSLINIQI